VAAASEGNIPSTRPPSRGSIGHCHRWHRRWWWRWSPKEEG
jgi:hypothetical protein